MAELILKEEVYAIVGAAMAVYNELGSGFSEGVYQEALELELLARVVPFERQKLLQIVYRGTILQKHYVADLICHGQIIVELKAQKSLGPVEEGQAICYLKATGFRLALLINFGDPARLDWQRIVR